jgi:hypothetical protein
MQQVLDQEKQNLQWQMEHQELLVQEQQKQEKKLEELSQQVLKQEEAIDELIQIVEGKIKS